MRLWRRTPKEKQHRCKVPRGTDPDSVFRCICGNRFMFYGTWTTAQYQLRYLNGPNRWSIWLQRHETIELARMTSEATHDEAKEWARAFFLADDLEILTFTTYTESDHISYTKVSAGLRAIARSEMP